MRVYEGYFVLPPEAAPEVRKNQIKAIEGLIEKFKGKILQKTEGGRRLLGYPLKKYKEGYAVSIDFELEPREQDPLGRVLILQEEVLKYMITHKEKPRREVPAAAPREKPAFKPNPPHDQKIPVS